MHAEEIATAFHRDGFVLVPGVFDPAELQDLAEHVFHVRQPSPSELRRYDANPYTLQGKGSLDELTPDELRRSERMLRLHLFDQRTRDLMLDPRLFALIRPLWPGEPLAVHNLYYPKPPGCRGMALHTDVGYLPVDPPEFAGVTIAVDDADEENGALAVVRGSHLIPCEARHTIPTDDFLFPEQFEQPAGTELVLVPMRAGDVLLFHGSTLHGSQPNRSATRWRRAFVAHYISAAVQSVHEHFHPAFRSSGEEIPAPGYAAAGG